MVRAAVLVLGIPGAFFFLRVYSSHRGYFPGIVWFGSDAGWYTTARAARAVSLPTTDGTGSGKKAGRVLEYKPFFFVSVPAFLHICLSMDTGRSSRLAVRGT